MSLAPIFSGLPSFAARLVRGGRGGLVLFNRWLEPDMDLESRCEFRPLACSSAPATNSAAAALDRHPPRPVSISLAATSGVHFTEDVIKSLLVGADVGDDGLGPHAATAPTA